MNVEERIVKLEEALRRTVVMAPVIAAAIAIAVAALNGTPTEAAEKGEYVTAAEKAEERAAELKRFHERLSKAGGGRRLAEARKAVADAEDLVREAKALQAVAENKGDKEATRKANLNVQACEKSLVNAKDKLATTREETAAERAQASRELHEAYAKERKAAELAGEAAYAKELEKIKKEGAPTLEAEKLKAEKEIAREQLKAEKAAVTYEVFSVSDGDTLTAGNFTVRLWRIDCPELAQPYGRAAKLFTSHLAEHKKVWLRVRGQDKHGRTLAEVILPDGKNLSEELLKAGLAWHYRAYVKSPALAKLEKQARQKKRGLWLLAAPVAPWDFRHSKTAPAKQGPKASKPASQPRVGADHQHEITVYITRRGDCYHRADCRYLRRSCIPISLKAAKREGYRPCSVCKPPRRPTKGTSGTGVAKDLKK